MPARRVLASLTITLALVAGCATQTPPGRPTGATPVPGPAGLSPTDAPDAPDATFTACRREAPAPTATNLRPSALTDAERGAVADWPGGSVPDGRLVLEHAAALPLPAGLLGFGNGYEASTGVLSDDVLRELAPPGTTADVTMAVLDSPSVGRRVAFVEVRLADGTPVRWEEEPALGFGTDGGDGGVYAPAYRGAPAAADDAAFAAIEAAFPDGDASAGHVCVVRTTEHGVDAVVFSAGYGDGGYPTFLGFDADGVVVSAVSYGGVLPWALSGLPGAPPDEPGI